MRVFVDAQAMAKANPDTFYVPSQAKLDAIKPGDIIKVCAIDPNGFGERFWNIVQTVEGDTIQAQVDNDLIGKHEFKCGDTIIFEKRHVYAIYED